MSQTFLIKLQALETSNLLKRDSCGIFKNTLFYWTSQVDASDSFRFPVCNFITKEILVKMFFCEFYKISETIFWQNTSGWLLLILRSFSEHLFYSTALKNCLFHVQAAVFQPVDTVKNYFTGVNQAFYTGTRSSHSKAFIYLKSLKIISEEVNS